jgi:D-alanine-D-alanine ligase
LQLRRDQRQPMLVEEFIEGEELTVGLVGNERPRTVGVMRILPRQPQERFVYSLEVKRDFLNQVRYECPPPLPADHVRAVEEAALLAFRALGCRDVARVDFRLRDGVPYFLEVNPLPGLNPATSDLVIMSRLVGLGHEGLIAAIVEAAARRLGL